MDYLLSLVMFILMVFGFVAFTKIISYFGRNRHYSVPAPDSSKGHRWVAVNDVIPGAYYCNVCKNSLVEGVQCEYCGIIADDTCFKKADVNIDCRLVASVGRLKHHWVTGNLPDGCVCEVCEDLCGTGPGLHDLHCCWCQSCVHTKCQHSFTSLCDLGRFKRFIVPPNCIRVKYVGWKGRRHLSVSEAWKPNQILDWRPLIVVANRLSGNGEGAIVLREFRKILNPVQVLDLNDVPPEVGLEWCRLLPNVRCRFLIAGGDGTIGWILSCAEKWNLEIEPEFCVMPLGTGNDLSRILGWGPGHTGEVNALFQLEHVLNARVQELDRWTVTVKPSKKLGVRLPERRLRMNNYISIGVDALVTLNFDRSRRQLPRVMSGRFMNKMLFFHYGTKDVLERACSRLHEHIELYLDGVKVEDMPPLEGIVILNIPYWGAGVKPWTLGSNSRGDVRMRNGTEYEHTPQYIDDGMLEVFGLYSSFHIAQLQVSLSEPYRLGQAKQIVLVIKGNNRFPMQVDGEPWLQGSGSIEISHKVRVRMLAAGYSSRSASAGSTSSDEGLKTVPFSSTDKEWQKI